MLTVATKCAISMVFPVHIHPCVIFSRFCRAGMNSVREILC